MNSLSPVAKVFVALTILAGATVLLYELVHMRPGSLVEFVVFLALSVVASRLKVKLPGVHGTMSVNLPFFLMAAIKLSVSEALLIACVGALAQSFGGSGRNRLVQIAFNAATLTNSVALAALASATAAQHQMVLPVAILAAGAAYFLGNTILMALVLWLAEGEKLLPIWARMVELSIPYYLLSATIAATVCGGIKNIGWTLALIVLVAMYLTYRSYRVYFARPGADTKAVATGAGT
jgi:hypothetical protein